PPSSRAHVFAAPPPTPISTLSLHDALPISAHPAGRRFPGGPPPIGPRGAAVAQPATRHHTARSDPAAAAHLEPARRGRPGDPVGDRKSTRLNSSHVKISYAVFCLKKKKTTK